MHEFIRYFISEKNDVLEFLCEITIDYITQVTHLLFCWLQICWFQNSWLCLLTKKVCLPSLLQGIFLVIFKILHWKWFRWQCTYYIMYNKTLFFRQTDRQTDWQTNRQMPDFHMRMGKTFCLIYNIISPTHYANFASLICSIHRGIKPGFVFQALNLLWCTTTSRCWRIIIWPWRSSFCKTKRTISL